MITRSMRRYTTCFVLMALLIYDWTATPAVARDGTHQSQRASVTTLSLNQSASCVDVCDLGMTSNDGKECALWDGSAQQWIDIGDGSASMHNRARLYNMWLRTYMLPAGGVCVGHFTDETYGEVERWSSSGDSALWTGTYLAAEAMRALMTGSPAAETNVNTLVHTLHDWWHVSGDVGYLARYAAPADSDPRILNMFQPPEPRDHLNTIYQGGPWNWRGHVSQDQYQGVMLGYSLAYEATSSPDIQAMIREDVVTFVEQLMRETPVTMRVKVGDKMVWPIDLEMQYTVFSHSETESGDPEVKIDIDDFSNVETWGFQEFDPEFINRVLEKIPLLGFLSPNLDIPRSGSAIMLASFFQVALQVTRDVPAYAERRQGIAEFYHARIDRWLDLAANALGYIRQSCGSAYFSYNVQFQPLYNLIRLETDVVVAHRVRESILNQRLWPEVADHKNVFFAYIYAVSQSQVADVQPIVAAHNHQLMLFPTAPRVSMPRDISNLYPASEDCDNQSSVAVDLDNRTVEDFTWQRHPWQLSSQGEPLTLYPGVDYLIAYWLGRYEGFLQDDADNTCLRWKPHS